MKYLNILFFIITILSITACTTSHQEESFMAPVRELSGKLIIDQDSAMLLGKRSSISAVINDVVYIFDPWGDHFFTKYDAIANKTDRFCKRGQGPGEVINTLGSVTLVSRTDGNYISVFDNYYCKFLFYKEDCITENDSIKELPLAERAMIGGAFPLNDSIVMVRGMFDKNICMFLKNGSKHSTCLESFTKVGSDDVKRIIKDANQFELSPDKGYMVRITQNGGLIEGYQIEDTQLIPQFSHNYFEVICKDDLSDTRDSRYGYIDVAVSQDKIYALYDGGLVSRENTYRSNVIHVYNREGDLLEKLLLDHYAKSVGVSSENRQLFVKSDNNDLLLFDL